MTKMSIYKGRERLNRGKLTDFNDLPEHIRENFKTLKILINEDFSDITEMFVFGSFKNGNWDNHSDYDILISGRMNIQEIKLKLAKKTSLKVDIFCDRINNDPILIP